MMAAPIESQPHLSSEVSVVARALFVRNDSDPPDSPADLSLDVR